MDELRRGEPVNGPAIDVVEVVRRFPHHTWFNGFEWVRGQDYYPQFAKASALICPDSILEVGTFEGLGLVSFIIGHEPSVVSWVDNESLLPGSNQRALENLQFLRTLGFSRFAIKSIAERLDDIHPRHYDLVHIDGAHDYPNCLLDMTWAYAVFTPRVMLVHDFANTEQHPGVAMAVEEFSKRYAYPYVRWHVAKGWAMFTRETALLEAIDMLAQPA